MAQQIPSKSVAQFNPRRHQLQAQIRSSAADSGNVSFGAHARDRMEERDITTMDALRVLRNGEIVGEIEPGKATGEWKCKMVAKRRGSRDLGVVSVVMQTGRLFVKTVEWEDQ